MNDRTTSGQKSLLRDQLIRLMRFNQYLTSWAKECPVGLLQLGGYTAVSTKWRYMIWWFQQRCDDAWHFITRNQTTLAQVWKIYWYGLRTKITSKSACICSCQRALLHSMTLQQPVVQDWEHGRQIAEMKQEHVTPKFDSCAFCASNSYGHSRLHMNMFRTPAMGLCSGDILSQKRQDSRIFFCHPCTHSRVVRKASASDGTTQISNLVLRF